MVLPDLKSDLDLELSPLGFSELDLDFQSVFWEGLGLGLKSFFSGLSNSLTKWNIDNIIYGICKHASHNIIKVLVDIVFLKFPLNLTLIPEYT